MSFVVMLLCAGAIILVVKYGLIAGLDQLAGALKWSAKTRGQATGLATSAPELVCLVAAGLAGVWDAGLWNIASSNIINSVLMLIAMLRYRQVRDLFHRRFIDEIAFSAVAVAVPLVLMKLSLDTHWGVIPLLLAFFVLYRVVDAKVNTADPLPATETVGSLRMGLILVVTALVGVAIVGIFLGWATEDVVNALGVHPAIAGWILGVCTSLPEMVTFFSVYGAAQREGKGHLLEDTQEALDNLASSNMANAGLIYPIGLAVFLISTAAMA
jgi:Ca2+/Na+ antiporter